MLTDRPRIVQASAPRYSRRKKPAKPSFTGPAIVQARAAIQSAPEPDPAPAAPRIVQAMLPKKSEAARATDRLHSRPDRLPIGHVLQGMPPATQTVGCRHRR